MSHRAWRERVYQEPIGKFHVNGCDSECTRGPGADRCVCVCVCVCECCGCVFSLAPSSWLLIFLHFQLVLTKSFSGRQWCLCKYENQAVLDCSLAAGLCWGKQMFPKQAGMGTDCVVLFNSHHSSFCGRETRGSGKSSCSCSHTLRNRLEEQRRGPYRSGWCLSPSLPPLPPSAGAKGGHALELWRGGPRPLV